MRRADAESGWFLEPVALSYLPHGSLLALRVKPVDVEDALEVVAFVLERLSEDSVAFQGNRVTVKINTLAARPWITQRLVPQTRHRKAALVNEFGLTTRFGDGRVEEVSDLSVHVKTKRAHSNADLRRCNTGPAR